MQAAGGGFGGILQANQGGGGGNQLNQARLVWSSMRWQQQRWWPFALNSWCLLAGGQRWQRQHLASQPGLQRRSWQPGQPGERRQGPHSSPKFLLRGAAALAAPAISPASSLACPQAAGGGNGSILQANQGGGAGNQANQARLAPTCTRTAGGRSLLTGTFSGLPAGGQRWWLSTPSKSICRPLVPQSGACGTRNSPTWQQFDLAPLGFT